MLWQRWPSGLTAVYQLNGMVNTLVASYTHNVTQHSPRLSVGVLLLCIRKWGGSGAMEMRDVRWWELLFKNSYTCDQFLHYTTNFPLLSYMFTKTLPFYWICTNSHTPNSSSYQTVVLVCAVCVRLEKQREGRPSQTRKKQHCPLESRAALCSDDDWVRTSMHTFNIQHINCTHEAKADMLYDLLRSLSARLAADFKVLSGNRRTRWTKTWEQCAKQQWLMKRHH